MPEFTVDGLKPDSSAPRGYRWARESITAISAMAAWAKARASGWLIPRVPGKIGAMGRHIEKKDG